MSGALSPLSRAHRRFLGTLTAGSVNQDVQLHEHLLIAHGLDPVFLQHLATAGIPRGGPLLGYWQDSVLTITHMLSSTPAGLTSLRDPLAIDPSYLLGALDGLQQVSGHPYDWVGHWYMAADGLETDELTDHLVWRRARRLALVTPGTVLLTIGHGEERPALHAYTVQSGEMLPLEITRESGGEA